MPPTPREPVGFWKTSTVAGYTRRDGRRVWPYVRRSWSVAFPVEDLKDVDLSHFGREKFRSPGTKPALPPAPAKVKLKSSEEWYSIAEYLTELYEEYEAFEVEDMLQKRNPNTDVISRVDHLIWHKPITRRTMAAIGALEAGLVTVWILLYNKTRDEYFVFSRSRSLIPELQRYTEVIHDWATLERLEKDRRTFSGIYAQAVTIYEGVVQWASTQTDYIEVRDLLAWTFWTRPDLNTPPEKAPRRPTSGKQRRTRTI